MTGIFLLWLSISVLGFLMMAIDKHQAIKHKKRISENTLILTACLGAALFMWLSMYLLHHKTKHPKFFIGLPLIAVIQGILLILSLHSL